MIARRKCQCSDHDAGGCAFAPSDDVCSCACHGAPAPTRLDPPIEIPIVVSVNRDPSARRRALAHLNRLRGWPTGAAPLDVQATPEHQEATSRILGSHEVRILVTHVDAEGRPTFELARGGS